MSWRQTKIFRIGQLPFATTSATNILTIPRLLSSSIHMSNRHSLSTINMPNDKLSLHILTEGDFIPDKCALQRLGTRTIGYATENQSPISTTVPGA